jgi:DNA (cytosine-5)-methyltransferase 1
MTFGSLFSGIGGIDLGLERAGMECKWQVEVDPFCQKVLAKHWPNVKRYGDITQLDGRELEWVDLLAGGFPCQDLSHAGKRVGIEGTRSSLWFEFARLVGELRPRFVLIENVPGLLVPGAMPRVVGELARLGYVGIWRCFRASEFGASHLRKRVFIVAHSSGQGRREDPRIPSGYEAANGRERWDILEPDGDHFVGSEGSGVAYSESGRRRELRESSGSERLTDRSNQELANAACSRSGRGLCQSDSQQDRNGISRRWFELEDSARDEQYRPQGESGRLRWRGVCEASEPMADASGSAIEILSDSSVQRLSNPQQSQLPGAERNKEGRATAELCGAFAPGPSDPRWPDILRERPDLAPAVESPLRGMADGVSDLLDRAMSSRTKRLSRLGNAVVPQIAEWIGRRILETEKHLSVSADSTS